jgi:hypothetical protein
MWAKIGYVAFGVLLGFFGRSLMATISCHRCMDAIRYREDAVRRVGEPCNPKS